MNPFVTALLQEGSSTVTAFVDDLRLFVPDQGHPHSNSQHLQHVLDLVQGISFHLHLVFNPLKTQILKVNAKLHSLPTFHSRLIRPQRQLKFLSMIFDDTGTYNKMVQKIKKRINNRLAHLRSLRRFFTVAQRRAAVQGYIISIMRYYINLI